MSLSGRPSVRGLKAFVEPPHRLGRKRWFVRGIADGSELTVYARNEKAMRRKLNRAQKRSRRANR